MAMNKETEVLATAKKYIRDVKKMAEGGGYSPEEYRHKLDVIRDSIVELSKAHEFGFVAELATATAKMLDQGALRTRSSVHWLNQEDMLYHINMFPTAPDALVNHISEYAPVNSIIVNSVVRSRLYNDTNHMTDTFRMLVELAGNRDIDNWIVLSKAMLALPTQIDMVIRTLSLIDNEIVELRKDEFSFIKETVETFKSNYFSEEYMGIRIDIENLLANLKLIGEVSTAHYLIGMGKGDFSEPHGIQRLITTYGYSPDEAYRTKMSNSSTVSERKGKDKHLPTSFFAYELSNAEPLVKMQRALNPELVKEILELDGCETPYGEIRYDPRKVEHFLDEILKESLHKHKKWETVCDLYGKELSEKTLMKSNFYRGKKISNDLGL